MTGGGPNDRAALTLTFVHDFGGGGTATLVCVREPGAPVHVASLRIVAIRAATLSNAPI